MPSVGYRTRRTKKGLLLVRKKDRSSSVGQLSGIGIIGFHHPTLQPAKKRVYSPKAREVIDRANKLLADATKPNEKAPWAYIDLKPTVKATLTRVGITKKGKLSLQVQPGTYGDNLRARDVLRKDLTQSQVRQLLRLENRSHGREGYAAAFPHLLGAAGLLSIGGQYLVIPNRGHTRLYDGFYHVIGGTVESERKKFNRSSTRPAQQALVEVGEETALDPSRLTFFTHGFRRLRSTKRAPALAFARTIEKTDPSADLVYAMDYKTSDPGKFIKEQFREKRSGEYELKAKPKDDEAVHFAIVHRSRDDIRAFIKKNSSRITPVLHIALEALLKEMGARQTLRNVRRRRAKQH